MISYNEAYEIAYESKHDPAKNRLKNLKDTMLAEWDRRTAQEQKRRQPRKRKNFDPLPKEWVDDLRDSMFREYGYTAKIQEYDNICAAKKMFLREIQAEVTISPGDDAWHKIDAISVYSFHTQGYGAKTYAKGELLPLQERLEELGFQTHIRISGHDYELWANSPRYMASIVKQGITLDYALAVWKRHAINPRVYLPMLPHDYPNSYL